MVYKDLDSLAKRIEQKLNVTRISIIPPVNNSMDIRLNYNNGTDMEELYLRKFWGYHDQVYTTDSPQAWVLSPDREEEIQKRVDGMDEIIKQVDTNSIFNEMYRGARKLIESKLPVFNTFLDRCVLVDDPRCETLYVMFNEILDTYEIHYSKKFIVNKAIQDTNFIPITPPGVTEIKNNLTNACAFYFSHEVAHVLRYHMNNQDSLVKGLNPLAINIIGDSFINTELSSVFDDSEGSSGKGRVNWGLIDNKLKFKLELKPDYMDIEALVRAMAKYLWTGYDGPLPDFNDSKIALSSVELTIAYSLDILYGAYKNNSNIFIKSISDFLNEVSVTKNSSMSSGGESAGISGGSGDPSDSSSDGIPNSGQSQGSGDSSKSEKQGSGGDSSDSSEDKSSSGDMDSKSDEAGSKSDEAGSKDDGMGGEGGTSSGSGSWKYDPEKARKEKEEASKTFDTEQSKETVKKTVRESYDSVQRKSDPVKPTSSANIDREREADILRGMGLDSIIRDLSTASDWKKLLRKMLVDCLGSAEQYNANMPSARIEGEFGRDEDITVPRDIALAIDCSGSMGPQKFNQVLKEVETFLVSSGLKRVRFHILYWGTEYHYLKLIKSKGLVSSIKASAKDCGGTILGPTFDHLQKHSRSYDLVMVFTDGELQDSNRKPPQTSQLAFVRKYRNRLIWVLTVGGDKSIIKAVFDPHMERRLIKPR